MLSTTPFPFALMGPMQVRPRYGSRLRSPDLCRSGRSLPHLDGYSFHFPTNTHENRLTSAFSITFPDRMHFHFGDALFSIAFLI